MYAKHSPLPPLQYPLIVVVLLQTYFALSSMTEWGHQDGSFDLKHFYHIIVKVLSDDKNKWVKETMDWWQRLSISIWELLHTTEHYPGSYLATELLAARQTSPGGFKSQGSQHT